MQNRLINVIKNISGRKQFGDANQQYLKWNWKHAILQLQKIYGRTLEVPVSSKMLRAGSSYMLADSSRTVKYSPSVKD